MTDRDLGQQRWLFDAIEHGRLAGALSSAPAQTSGPGYGLVGAPLHVVAGWFVDDRQAYVAVGIAMLVPLAVALVAASRAVGTPARSRRELATLAVALVSAPTLACLTEVFHPADLLATAAVLGAFALLARQRSDWAAVLLGFALLTRQWALLPIAVLAVLQRGRHRTLVAVGAPATFAVGLLPFFLADPQQTLRVLRASEVTSGDHLTAPGLPDLGDPTAYALSRLVPVVAVAGLCWWLWRRADAARPAPVAIAAVAVALLVRPVLDPAGYLYYLVPGGAALTVSGTRSARWLAGCAAGSLALTLRWHLADGHPSLDVDGALRLPGAALSVGATVVVAVALVVALRSLADRVATGAPDPARTLPV